MGKDRYGRAVVILYFLDGITRLEKLLSAGYAWIAHRYCKRAECLKWKKLEARALVEKRELWRHPHPLPS
ncbi:thermonuclease family protein [Desulfovibrio sp.]|uniref:thermonuclease family protein n=1 Tax=Desulfovibrio sp. TaxID=885 RepID=UPI00338F30BA